jgi:hypothetical protein
MHGWGSLRKRWLGIRPEAIAFDRLGFRSGTPDARRLLERITGAFATGYHAVLEDDHLEVLVPRLDNVAPEYQGFAFEGAGMGLALLDYLTLWHKRRVAAFLYGAGSRHAYLVHVGVGWAMARMHRDPQSTRERLDPLLGWLAIDGYGFHEGFFHWAHYLGGQPLPARLTGYDRRAFDQGLGRSLWFVEGADPAQIPRVISRFSAERQADLWSGVGLAATYAGGIGETGLKALADSAAVHRPPLAQGAAFAAKAREHAGHILDHTQLACAVLCRKSAEDAARLTDQALANLDGTGPEPAYEVWRQRVQRALAVS